MKSYGENDVKVGLALCSLANTKCSKGELYNFLISLVLKCKLWEKCVNSARRGCDTSHWFLDFFQETLTKPSFYIERLFRFSKILNVQ